MQYFGVSVWCLEGVWEASGVCLSDSWYCQGGSMCKHPFHSFSPADSFSASCLKLYKMGHILGCPEGVWRVSWRCLGIIWVTLDTVWMGMLSAQLKKIILGHFNQLRHFLTVANFRRFRAQNAKFQVWFYIWRSPQIKKNPIETGLKIKFPVRIQMDRSYNWDRTSQWALMYTCTCTYITAANLASHPGSDVAQAADLYKSWHQLPS